MDYYKILIVDDEEDTRESIIKKINWQENGFEVVSDAGNGQEALELAQQLCPDVVLSDIKMPFMDGIELGRHLKRLMPSTKLVILSGFDDFEYAQQAIKINVMEYILKPINAQELTKLLQRLKMQLDEEFDEKRNIDTLRKYYLESLPIIKDHFYMGLLEGSLSQNDINNYSIPCELNLKGKHFGVALISISESKDLQKELVPISINRMIKEILNESIQFVSVLGFNAISILCSFERKEDIKIIISNFDEICKHVKRVLNVEITVGIGLPCNGLLEINGCAIGAKAALDYQVAFGSSKAIYIGDVEPDFSLHIQFEEKDEKALTRAIKLCSREEVEVVIGQAFLHFKEQCVPFYQYQTYLWEIMTAIIKMCHTYQINIDTILGERFDFYGYISNNKSLQTIQKWFVEISLKISFVIQKKRIDCSKMLAENAKQYVNENYHECNLSIEDLCNYLHISPAYFSTIFKREVGISFVTYLTQTRLEKALELLNTTADKTYIIAEKVGYIDPTYFSYVFKKQFGVSPSKYRSK